MRVDQLRTATRLAAGRYTSFLVPAWGPEEHEAMEEGGTGSGGRVAALEQAATGLLPPGWHVVATSSARVALRLLLEAWHLDPGAEVAIPSFSCSGLVEPVLQAGLRPVLVDVDEELNLSPSGLVAADGPDLAAVVLPHLAGVPARGLAEVVCWARGRGVRVVEDLAQAAGLAVDHRLTGSAADASIYSTGPGKPLFGPGGGWLATPNAHLARQVRAALVPEPPAAVARRLSSFRHRHLSEGAGRLRAAITDRRAVIGAPGDTVSEVVPYALSDAEAGIARAQIGRLAPQIARRQEHAARWRRLLDEAGVDVKTAPLHGTAAKFWVTADDPAGREQAARLKQVLRRAGVEVEPLYVPLHRRPRYQGLRAASLATTDRLARDVYSVPVRSNLDERDWARIERAVADAGSRL